MLLSAPPDTWENEGHAIEWFNEHHATGDSRLNRADWDAAAKVANLTQSAGIVAIPIGDENYPAYLAAIQDPPPVLYVKGNLELLRKPAGVAIVGTRKASPNGIIIAERISKYFAESGWTIVSGLAMGIDAAAHRGALSVRGATIAVLAHGLRSASPKINSHLGSEILESGGAWVSEYPIDIPAKPEQFVLRNRIQIGLSAGSIIVEGEERSGTMTQAEFCLRNKRKLFAVLPEKIDALKLVATGPLILVNKRGATPLRSKEDYAAALKSMETVRSSIAFAGPRSSVAD
ncbi:DNA-processing protein DprA [Achromobacter sp. SIMBA_011]|uniref:DNA-processing protein DprA n=1 Tax=Achromobacter TaxID=222 RepID=UPI002E18D7CF|nr:DNA-processing protein DprA [Achromobacter xylosoxidans]